MIYCATVYTEDGDTLHVRALNEKMRNRAINRIEEDEEINDVDYFTE